jgi:hypothetical protein
MAVARGTDLLKKVGAGNISLFDYFCFLSGRFQPSIVKH